MSKSRRAPVHFRIRPESRSCNSASSCLVQSYDARTHSGGDAYASQELEVMLLNAGFTRNKLLQVPRSPQQVIIGTK